MNALPKKKPVLMSCVADGISCTGQSVYTLAYFNMNISDASFFWLKN